MSTEMKAQAVTISPAPAVVVTAETTKPPGRGLLRRIGGAVTGTVRGVASAVASTPSALLNRVRRARRPVMTESSGPVVPRPSDINANFNALQACLNKLAEAYQRGNRTPASTTERTALVNQVAREFVAAGITEPDLVEANINALVSANHTNTALRTQMINRVIAAVQAQLPEVADVSDDASLIASLATVTLAQPASSSLSVSMADMEQRLNGMSSRRPLPPLPPRPVTNQ